MVNPVAAVQFAAERDDGHGQLWQLTMMRIANLILSSDVDGKIDIGIVSISFLFRLRYIQKKIPWVGAGAEEEITKSSSPTLCSSFHRKRKDGYQNVSFLSTVSICHHKNYVVWTFTTYFIRHYLWTVTTSEKGDPNKPKREVFGSDLR